MAKTMGQALAEQIRRQVKVGETVLQLAGTGTAQDRSDAVIGPAEKVLTVRANVSDVAHMNHLWYLFAHQSGALTSPVPDDLKASIPASFPEVRAFLSPRETQTADEAIRHLRRINEQWAAEIGGLSDEALEAPVRSPFPGSYCLRDVAFRALTHGALHLGQAWGILKGAEITDAGFEILTIQALVQAQQTGG